nr:odorant receptor 3 [Pachyrhinus yasumatsui]
MDVYKVEPSNSYATDFFFVNRWMLRCAGLWRPESKNERVQFLYKIYAIIVFIFVNLWFTSTEFVSLFYTYKNESEFIKNINFFLTHFMGAVKVIFWYFNGNYLRSIMKSLEDPKLQYENYMHFKPGNLSREYKTIGIKYSLLFLSLAHATLMSSYVPPLITTLKFIKHDRTPNSTMSLPDRLPYYSWMPFPYYTGNMYLLAMAYQAGPMFSYAYSIVGMDTLFMNIMNCIAANVSIIQGAFPTLRERCVSRLNNITSNSNPLIENKKMMASMDTELKKIIKHLQIIFKASDDLEQIHRYVTLCQVTATLFILCTCLYLVSMAPPLSKQFIAECVYMAAMFFQLYLYCSFGNEVTLKFQELPYYIWDSNWFATNTSFKKKMMFTMMRAKRPVYFTAGKFSPLTLPTFMSIIKTSYSIFALIKHTSN